MEVRKTMGPPATTSTSPRRSTPWEDATSSWKKLVMGSFCDPYHQQTKNEEKEDDDCTADDSSTEEEECASPRSLPGVEPPTDVVHNSIIVKKHVKKPSTVATTISTTKSGTITVSPFLILLVVAFLLWCLALYADFGSNLVENRIVDEMMEKKIVFSKEWTTANLKGLGDKVMSSKKWMTATVKNTNMKDVGDKVMSGKEWVALKLEKATLKGLGDKMILGKEWVAGNVKNVTLKDVGDKMRTSKEWVTVKLEKGTGHIQGHLHESAIESMLA